MPLLCLNGHVVAVLCGSSAILMLYVYYLLISNPLCVTYNALTVEPPRGTEVGTVQYTQYTLCPQSGARLQAVWEVCCVFSS